MVRIVTLSKIMSYALISMFIFVTAGTVAVWVMAPASFTFLADVGAHCIHALRHPVVGSEFTGWQKLLGFSIDLIPTSLTLLMLYNGIKLCGLYQQLSIFAEENARRLYWIAIFLCTQQLISPFYEAFITPVLTWHNPPGERIISMSISSTNFGMLLLSLGFLLMSLIMREGARLKSDNATII